MSADKVYEMKVNFGGIELYNTIHFPITGHAYYTDLKTH